MLYKMQLFSKEKTQDFFHQFWKNKFKFYFSWWIFKRWWWCSILAKIDSSLKSVVSLYPFIENPVASDFNHGIPTIIISGQLNIIAPPALHADIHYDYIPITTNKLKFEVALGS